MLAEGALYGLQRAGFDWEACSKEKLVANEWTQFVDAQRSMYEKSFKEVSPVPVELGAFVDYFKVGASRVEAAAAWFELKTLFALGDVNACEKFAGICQSADKLSPLLTRVY